MKSYKISFKKLPNIPSRTVIRYYFPFLIWGCMNTVFNFFLFIFFSAISFMLLVWGKQSKCLNLFTTLKVRNFIWNNNFSCFIYCLFKALFKIFSISALSRKVLRPIFTLRIFPWLNQLFNVFGLSLRILEASATVSRGWDSWFNISWHLCLDIKLKKTKI